MSKVDWITWKTSPKDIINPDIIVNNIQDNYQKYNTYMNPVIYEQIKHEIYNGILGKDKIVFMKDTPINEIAQDIISKIENIKMTIDNLLVNVRESAEEQKQIEKQQLIEEIEKKIEVEQDNLNQFTSSEIMQKKIISMGGLPEDIIYILEDRINKLKERLEIAKSL